MIGTVQKPLGEIVGALEAFRRIGCGGMRRLRKGVRDRRYRAGREDGEGPWHAGKEIIFDVTPERTCYLNKSRDAFGPLREELNNTEALLVLGCGVPFR